MKIDYSMRSKDKIFKYGGWLVSFLAIVAGVSFLWPHIHTDVLGIALIYIGVRIFNFSTFDEYKEKRMELILKFLE